MTISTCSPTTATALLPCPFCGGEAECNGSPKDVMGQIYCANDECFGPRTTAITKQDSIVQWNTRAGAAPATPAPGDVGELMERLRGIATRRGGNIGYSVRMACEQAADALEASSAETADRDRLKRDALKLNHQIDEWQERALAAEARLAEAVAAIRNYFATFDRCGGSDSVSAEEFAERRAAMRRVVEGA